MLRGRLSAMFVSADPCLEGLWRISHDGTWPRPHVLVVGALHGNEPCGLRAIEGLRAQAEAGALDGLAGTLLLLHGNPPATEQGRRFTEGGTDLNRLFDYAFERALKVSEWTTEHHRAAALRPVLSDADAALDLHSSTRPTPAFAITTELEGSRTLAGRLGVPFVVRGWTGPGMLGDRVLLAPLDARGMPSVAVECGDHRAEQAVEWAQRVTRRFLEAVGVLAVDGLRAPETPSQQLRLHDAIRKPSREFRFSRPLSGFDELRAGDEIGSDGLLSVRAAGACFAVMPNDTVGAGDDMLYLAVHDT